MALGIYLVPCPSPITGEASRDYGGETSGRLSIQMTRHLMASIHLLQHWFNFGTNRHGEWTARMKAAARGWVQRTGDLTGNSYFFALFVRVCRQGRRKEPLAVGMEWFHP